VSNCKLLKKDPAPWT